MTKKQKKTLIKIVAAGIVFVAVLVTLKVMGLDAEELPFYVGVPIFAVPFLIVGFDILRKAFLNIIRGQIFDENFLMAIAALGAFIIGEYTEAVVVMLLYQLGQLIESVAVGRSRKSIAAVMDIRPASATVLRDGAPVTVSPEEVKIGESIVVRPGERIPLDGVISEGVTTINTVALTGEAIPRDAKAGDRVVSGTINETSPITVTVDKEYSDSTVAKVLRLVEESSMKKAKSEGFITRFAKYYTPAVVILAALVAFLPPLFGADLKESVLRALDYLVISCPCAIVISVPLAFVAGMGRCSKAGVLVKGSEYLEKMAKTDTVVFDKTGTLTEGSFKVTAIHPETVSEKELLEIAVMAESWSTHPISASLKLAYNEEIDSSRIGYIKEIAGMGIEAQIDDRIVYVGNSKLMEKYRAAWHKCELVGTLIHIAIMPCEHNHHGEDCSCTAEYMGHILVSDRVKENTSAALGMLRKSGVSTVSMLSGDTEEVASSVAASLSLDSYRAGLMPDGKVGALEEMMTSKKEGRTLCFVGDGINDAPVLSRADVGIAMGGIGSDAAIEAADIVIMDDDLTRLSSVIGISKKVRSTVLANILFTILFKVAVMALSPFGLCPVWLAVFADVGVMVIAVMNSLRLLTVKG